MNRWGRVAISVVIAWCGFAPTALGQRSSQPGLFTEMLRNEAEGLIRDKSDAWCAMEQAVEDTAVAHAEFCRGWLDHLPPPRLDLSTLELPLSFLVWNYEETRDSSDQWVAGISRALAHAIAQSGDARAADYLLEQYDTRQVRLSTWIVVAAVDKYRAAEEIVVRLNSAAGSSSKQLVAGLIDQFAEDLPDVVAAKAFDFIREFEPNRRILSRNSPPWPTLFRLNPARAAHEIISLYDSAADKRTIEQQYHIVELLREFATPSEEVAQAARRWISETDSNLWPPILVRLRILLFQAAPDTELDTFIAGLDEYLSNVGKPEWDSYHLDTMVEALVQWGPPAAAPALRRFAREPRVGYFKRIAVIQRLVRERDEDAEQIVRWFVDHEQPQDVRMLHFHLKQSGEYGVELSNRYGT